MKRLIAVVAVAAALWLVWRAWPASSSQSDAAHRAPDASRAFSTPERGLAEPSAPSANESTQRAQVETPTPATAHSTREARPVVRLVDERTGEPVPFFELSLEPAPSDAAVVRSDADGRVELPARADTTLLLRENESGSDRIQTRSEALSRLPHSVAVARGDLGATVLDVRIPVGPTYRLSFALPPAHTLADVSATLRSADPRMAFDQAYAELRDERAPWTRFRPTALFVSGGPPWKLELATSDGLWYGAAEVTSIQGIQRDVVAIALEPRACLQGTVRDDANQPIVREYVRIERDGASFVGTDNRPLFGLTDADGRYAIRGVPPGAYVAKCAVDGHRDAESPIELVAGVARELDLVVARIPQQELAHVEGRVESDSGTYRERLYVFASPEPHSSSVRRCDVAWSTVGGRAIGTFTFDLAPGTYRLNVGGNRLIEVEPADVTWQPGSPSPVFRVRDSVALGVLRFHASDPSGADVPQFRVRVTVAGAHVTLAHQVASTTGVVTVEGVPLGAQCEYRAMADDRQSVWGTCSVSATDSAPIELRLPMGWSTEVVTTDDRGAPLANVRVIFDGEVRGQTDANGALRVTLDHTPTGVFFELDGWKPVERGDYSAETGRFRSWLPSLTIALERR